MGKYDTKCPECSERLNIDARRCACGWENPKYGKASATTMKTDPRCTYSHGGMRCQHPVGYHDPGSESGWCIFHRAIDPKEQPQLGRDIVLDSQDCTREQYLVMARAKTYGRGDSFEVAKIRARLTDPSHWPSSTLDVKSVAST